MDRPDDHQEAARAEHHRHRGPSGAAVGGGLLTLAAIGSKAKLAVPALTMAASIGAYTLLWGLPFAIGIVILLLVHELGHYGAARAQGLKVSLPTFVPLLGAFVRVAERDPRSGMLTALAGPAVGGLGALACLALGAASGSELLSAMAYTGFVLNLLNLLPVPPFDGGAVAGAISTRLWVAGLVLLVALMLISFNPLLLVVAVLGAVQVWGRLGDPGEDEDDGSEPAAAPAVRPTRQLAGGDRWLAAGLYFAIAALLWLGVQASFVDVD